MTDAERDRDAVVVFLDDPAAGLLVFAGAAMALSAPRGFDFGPGLARDLAAETAAALGFAAG